MSLRAEKFPEAAVRTRARLGTTSLFPAVAGYGCGLFGADHSAVTSPDLLDAARLVPPVFMPERLEKLIELGREPLHGDVDLATVVGGFRSSLPVFLPAFGSTRAASADLGVAVSRQAGRLGIPMVIGENVVPINGYANPDHDFERTMLGRLRAYAEHAPPGLGGVAIQQSTEDADSEVWNLVYSDLAAQPLLDSGRLAFELKVGQGAKPGLGGMTVLDKAEAARVADAYTIELPFGDDVDCRLRCSSPGTFTQEILRQQVHLMRNNFPRARVWVKLHPGRDVSEAAAVAWAAGADAVTVDGAEGGTGWAPTSFLDHVGLPLGECLRRIGCPQDCLLATGRMWEGTRAAKAIALGATAVGVGRAALLAADEDSEAGLIRLVECLAVELRMLISALGKYSPAALRPDDIWWPDDAAPAMPGVREPAQ